VWGGVCQPQKPIHVRRSPSVCLWLICIIEILSHPQLMLPSNDLLLPIMLSYNAKHQCRLLCITLLQTLIQDVMHDTITERHAGCYAQPYHKASCRYLIQGVMRNVVHRTIT
jgi:hypothetical protein